MATRRWLAAGALLGGLGAGCRAPDLEFGEARAVSAATNVGVAPTFAVSPTGDEATAWISAPGGGTDGRMYVSINGASPSELKDRLGAIEAHAEAPPKIAYAPDGSLHAVYVVAKVEPGRRFPLTALRHARSADGGRTWGAPTTVTDNGDFGSHNFHALHLAKDGRAYVAWLDGRAGKSGAYLTWSADAGATWAPNIRVSIEEACPCCRTAIASDSGGVVYLAWRTVGAGNVRDVVVARSADGGATWGTPVSVHVDGWVYHGCPHAGPSMVVDASHRLHVAWWTGKPGDAGVFYARAIHENHFGNRVTMASADASRPAHVQLAVDGERVVVTWDDGIRKTPTVRMRMSRDAGATFGREVVASPRNLIATYPVLAFVNGNLTVAWTEQDPAAHARAQASQPDMSDPGAVKGLTPVGEARVIARKAVVN